MPVEIRDFVIRANIVDANEQKPDSKAGNQSTSTSGSLSENERTRLIEDTVEQVMLLLNRMQDR